ncbi:MAG: flippase-like domain-containing protein [Marinilabiliaceae bacterium]|nr:flippase-like domain-containing protein [Marinilabiliaceae bacterium]
MTEKLKNKLLNIAKQTVKVGISALALWFVISHIDIKNTWDTIRNANNLLIAAAIIVYALSQIAAAQRLNILFRTIPFEISSIANIRLYWLGLFYNFFLPGGVGGDGYKVYYLHKHHNQPVKALTALVLADRLNGLCTIVIFLLIFSSFFLESLPFPYHEYYFLAIPLVLIGYRVFLKIFKHCALQAFWRVTLTSAISQGLQMCSATLILISLAGTNCSFDSYLFLFFASSIASAIPMTMGGVGAREMTFLIGSKYLNTDDNVAIALSLLFYICSLFCALPGIVYAIRPSMIEKSDAINAPKVD